MQSRRHAWLKPALVLIALGSLPFSSEAQPTFLDLRIYRTPASPGELHEDAVFLKEVVESLAKDVTLPPVVPRDGEGFESFDVRIDRDKVLEPDGSWKRDEKGRPIFSVTPTIEIKGDVYKQITRAYLEWRRGFEFEWIRTAQSATEELKPTPIQVLFHHPTLPRSEKVRETVHFYRLNTLPRFPKPTPNPAYWPISPIIDLPDSGVQVQFNLRGGQVTVLDAESSQVWVLPFPPEVDPNRWIEEYQREVKKVGKVKAAERLKKQAISWGLPNIPNPQGVPTDPAAEKAPEEIPKE